MKKFYDTDGPNGSAGGLTTDVVEKASPSDVQSELKKLKGAFVSSLQRNNKDIRNDRALSIAQKAKRAFKRKVEDLADSVREMKIERENMLDLSASDRNSLVLAANFDPEAFVSADVALGTKIRNTEISLQIAAERYEYLFGEQILNN